MEAGREHFKFRILHRTLKIQCKILDIALKFLKIKLKKSHDLKSRILIAS